MSEFDTPQYCQNFKKIFPFTEYGDNDTYFIELVYYIATDKFISHIGETLHNKVAMNNEYIFSVADKIDFTKFKLLNEKRDQSEIPSVEMITETYGYAPNKTYLTYSSEPVVRVGLEDDTKSTVAININTSSSYDFDSHRFKIYVTNTAPFHSGDAVIFKLIGNRPYWYDASSGWVHVFEVNHEEKYLVVEAFNLEYRNYSGYVTGSYSEEDTILFFNHPNVNWLGNRYCVKEVDVRQPTNIISTVHNYITISDTFPELDSKLTIMQGGSEVDTISRVTNPSNEEWVEKVKNKELFNAFDATVEMIYPNTLFKKVVKKTLCR